MSDDFEWKGHNPNDDEGSSNDDDLDLSWRRDDSEDGQADDPNQTGVTGLLDWKKAELSEDDPFGKTGDNDFPEINWDTPEGEQSGGTARTGVTGALSWLQDHESAFERQLDEAENAAKSLLDDQADISPSEPTPADAENEDLPDWLMNDEPITPSQPQPPHHAVNADDDEDLPDWLIADEPQTAQPTSFSQHETTFDDFNASDDEDLPDWLIADEPQTAQPTSFTQQESAFDDFDASDDEDLPDWLIADEPQTAQPTSFSQQESAFDDFDNSDDEDLPDWLIVDEPQTAQPTSFSQQQSSAFDDFDNSDDDTPDWLVTEQDDLPHQDPFVHQKVRDVPDWLSEDQPAEEQPTSSISDVPDWLQELPDDAPQEELDPFLSSFADSGDNDDSFDFETFEESAPVVPSFDDFSDEDFSAEIQTDDDNFNLFSDSSSKTGLTGMLGGVDFDDDESDSFDLFGELAGDGKDTPASFDDQEDPDDAFSRLFGDQAVDDFSADTPIADSVSDDEDFLREARSLGFGTREFDSLDDEDDPFRDAFFDQEPQTSKAADPSELDWLSGIPDAPFNDRSDIDKALQQEQSNYIPDEFAPAKPSFASVDDFLASLDDDIDLPTTQSGHLVNQDDLDLDTLFGSDDNVLTDDSEPLELSEDAPDWLVDLSEGAVGAGTAAALARQISDRPIDELDNRLKNLRERGLNLNIKNVTGDTPEIDRIIPGVSNTLPAVVFNPGEVDVTTDVLLTEEQRQRTAILRELTGTEKTAETKAGRRRFITDRLLIGLLLLGFIALPFLVKNLDIGNNRPHQFLPNSVPMSFYQQIEQVRADDLVLIAVELGSAGGAELDHATGALVRHIWARGGVPVIVSGNPIGLLRTDRLLTTLAEENNLVRNQDYVIGSFLVGDTIGLRNFAQNIPQYVNNDVEGNATGLDIHSLDDFRLIVLLVEDAERARAWGEQISPITKTVLTAITSQSAMPLSAPYFERMMSGYQDGVIYESMVSTLIASDGQHDFMVLPTATPTPTATATPIPTVTPIPTETPLPSATPEAELSPEPTVEGGAVIGDDEVDQTPTEDQPDVETTSTPSATLTLTPTLTHTPAPTVTPTETPLPENARMASTLDSAVNVRSASNVGAGAVGALRVADSALIIGEETNEFGELWYHIRFFNVNGILIEGWIRSDLVTIETTTGNIERFYPTPTPQASSQSKGAVFAKMPALSQTDDAPEEITDETLTADDENTVAEPVSTPRPLYDYNLQILQDAIDDYMDSIPQGLRPLERSIQPPTMGESDARWDSITLGLVFAIVVITSGSVFNVLRAVRRRNRNVED